MSELRVSAGQLKGRKVPVPDSDIRPTSDRARQALFNIISNRIVGASFLDLFAGTGIFSFEAVSRGASEAVAVDISRKTIRLIEARAAEWKVPVRGVALDLDRTPDAVARLGEFDVVFADPPYDWNGRETLLATIDQQLRLRPDAVVAIEHRRGALDVTQLGLARLLFRKTAEYGTIAISFFDYAAGEQT